MDVNTEEALACVGQRGKEEVGMRDFEGSVRRPTRDLLLEDTAGHHVKLVMEVSPSPTLPLDI